MGVLLAVSTLLLALATLSLLLCPRTQMGEVTMTKLTGSEEFTMGRLTGGEEVTGISTQAIGAAGAQPPTMELCPICKMMIGELDSLVQDKNNEKKIKEALETVCHILPRPMRTECSHIVE